MGEVNFDWRTGGLICEIKLTAAQAEQ